MMKRISNGRVLITLTTLLLVLLLTSACGVLNGPKVVPPKREYTADFDGKQDDWVITGSGYSFAEGDLVVTSGTGDAFLGEETWSNFEIEAEVTMTAFPTYGSLRFLLGWDPTTTSGYAVTVANGAVILHQYDAGSAKTVASNTSVVAKLDQRYPIKIRVNEGRITVRSGDTELFEVGGADVYPEGRVGFKASNSASARVHSFSVQEL